MASLRGHPVRRKGLRIAASRPATLTRQCSGRVPVATCDPFAQCPLARRVTRQRLSSFGTRPLVISMARLSFFATTKDCLAILDFLFASTDCCLYELYSEYDMPIRKYSNLSEAQRAFQPGRAPGSVLPTHLRPWSPSAFSDPVIERISLRPDKCQGHTFRYVFRGPGSVVFHFGGMTKNEIGYSEYSHFEEPSQTLEDGVNWPVFKKLSGKIQYHIRGRLATAKLPGRCVLPDAMEHAKQGSLLVRHQLLRWRFSGGELVQCAQTKQ